MENKKKKELEEYLRKLPKETTVVSLKFSEDQPRVPAGNPTGGEWTSGGLTEEEIKRAVTDHLSFGYYPNNEYLRKNNNTYEDMYTGERESEVKKEIELIDEAIKKYGEDYTGTLYRGTKAYYEGVDLGYPSATFSEELGRKYANPYLLIIKAENVRGLNIEKYLGVNNLDESEFLLERGLNFRIDKIDGYEIKVTVTKT